MLNLLDDSILGISAELRKIALIIILTRAGLGLDLSGLKKIGRPAVLMCFVPASFELIGMILLALLLLLLLALLLPAGIHFRWSHIGGLRLQLCYGPLHFTLYPRKADEEEKKAEPKTPAAKKSAAGRKAFRAPCAPIPGSG